MVTPSKMRKLSFTAREAERKEALDKVLEKIRQNSEKGVNRLSMRDVDIAYYTLSALDEMGFLIDEFTGVIYW